MNLEGKSVIDMGTGTAILAVLASMRGAQPVVGIEIDHGAWENAVDNVRLNSAKAEIIEGDASALAGIEEADVFIANINRNIITGDMPFYASCLQTWRHDVAERILRIRHPYCGGSGKSFRNRTEGTAHRQRLGRHKACKGRMTPS